MSNQPEETSEHIFGVTCENHHISYFDKRIVCKEQAIVVRVLRGEGDVQLSELLLKCRTCGEPLVVAVDCEDYGP